MDSETGGKMTKLIYDASWSGEPNAGIMPGSEEVTIQFKYGQPIDEDVIEYWREAIAEFYDGAHVEFIRASGREAK
jgi:hypothetical protein